MIINVLVVIEILYRFFIDIYFWRYRPPLLLTYRFALVKECVYTVFFSYLSS